MQGSPFVLLDLAASRLADRRREAAAWRLARAARAPAPSLRRRLASALRGLANWLAQQPSPASGGYGGPFRLADGRVVWLRPLRADDAPRLIDLSTRLSLETVRRRFLRERPACDPKEAHELAAAEQTRHVAIAAVPSPAAPGPIVAVGRFHGNGPQRAELALLVEDAYQHVGLGRLLLTRLIEEAEQRHLRLLEGYALYDNAPVLRLLRSSGWPLDVRHHDGAVLVVQLLLGLRPHRPGSSVPVSSSSFAPDG